ncbi:Rossmann-fold NAD(P)-binding domain-containing protein [Sphingobacterium paludis]|uniref:Nucleoside-diphosphate-sugar epimerase n=1 Tax=Sphingobacterium paludis TaxID=1476465 RepID=A0A4R7CVC6_9SPHI|nr:hypothetical protein [Sphingobacterium paludis]TDS12423.1 hypothetical protein B0I21_106281 [Sphingobacterium paludis]
MDILISGLNNYVGQRSVSLMADEKTNVYAITRNIKLFEKRPFEPIRAKLYELDLLKAELDKDLPIPDINAAFYFTQVPTLCDVVNLKLELLCLRNFIHILKKKNCNRLVYVVRLMDKICIQMVLDLLKEFNMDYTVVLKNSVVGNGSLIDRVFKNIAKRRFIYYSKGYANRVFQPLGAHDLIRWLKRILEVPAFHYQVLEVGGEEEFSFMTMFTHYKQLQLIPSGQRIVNVPRWLVKFMYQYKLDISSTDYAELSRIIQSDNRADNNWKADMTFEFSKVSDILQLDR